MSVMETLIVMLGFLTALVVVVIVFGTVIMKLGIAGLQALTRRACERQLRELKRHMIESCQQAAQNRNLSIDVEAKYSFFSGCMDLSYRLQILEAVPPFVTWTLAELKNGEVLNQLDADPWLQIESAVKDLGVEIVNGNVSINGTSGVDWRPMRFDQKVLRQFAQRKQLLDRVCETAFEVADLTRGLRPDAADWLCDSAEQLGQVRALRLLHGHYPEHAATERACRRGLDHDDPSVRIEAAIGLGVEQLLHVAQQVDVLDVAVSTWRWALSFLPRGDEAEQLVNRLWVVEDTELLLDAIQWLVRSNAVPDLDLLSRLVARQPHSEVASCWLRALGDTCDPQAIEPICQRLQIELDGVGNRALILVAVQALAQVGSAEVVPLLREVHRRWGAKDALALAATDSIERIQSRLEYAESGSLALATKSAEAGALRLAESAGQLALAAEDDRAGRDVSPTYP